MCVYSMISDHYWEKWVPRHPRPWTLPDFPGYPRTPEPPQPYIHPATSPVSPEEFKKLAEEVEELRKLLERARKYDERTGQPECELDEKRKALKKLAEELGVDISFL